MSLGFSTPFGLIVIIGGISSHITESGLAAHCSEISTGVKQMLVEKKIAFDQNACSLER